MSFSRRPSGALGLFVDDPTLAAGPLGRGQTQPGEGWERDRSKVCATIHPKALCLEVWALESKLTVLFVPQFPHLQSGDRNGPKRTGLLGGLTDHESL